jgi:hypothetical protein
MLDADGFRRRRLVAYELVGEPDSAGDALQSTAVAL